MADSCEHGNETSGSVKRREFSWLAEWLLALQGQLRSMKLVGYSTMNNALIAFRVVNTIIYDVFSNQLTTTVSCMQRLDTWRMSPNVQHAIKRGSVDTGYAVTCTHAHILCRDGITTCHYLLIIQEEKFMILQQLQG